MLFYSGTHIYTHATPCETIMQRLAQQQDTLPLHAHFSFQWICSSTFHRPNSTKPEQMSPSIRLQLYSILSKPSRSPQEAKLGTCFSVGTFCCSDGSSGVNPSLLVICYQPAVWREVWGLWFSIYVASELSNSSLYVNTYKDTFQWCLCMY